jgi:hypothetical protein
VFDNTLTSSAGDDIRESLNVNVKLRRRQSLNVLIGYRTSVAVRIVDCHRSMRVCMLAVIRLPASGVSPSPLPAARQTTGIARPPSTPPPRHARIERAWPRVLDVPPGPRLGRCAAALSDLGRELEPQQQQVTSYAASRLDTRAAAVG